MPEEPRIPLRYICVKRRPGTEDPPVVARKRWGRSDYLSLVGLVAIVGSILAWGAWGAYQRLESMTPADWRNAGLMLAGIAVMLVLLSIGYFAGREDGPRRR